MTGAGGSRQLTVVGVATPVTGTARARVVPAEITALHGRGVAQMLYRFASAGSAPRSARTSRRSAPRCRPERCSARRCRAWPRGSRRPARIAPFVPFILAFGVIALVMSVLIVINVISGAVVAGTRRIGVLKSIGCTPGQVVA